MESKKLLLVNLSNEILKIDCHQSTSKIIKELDKLVQQSYLHLYKLDNIKCNKEIDQKKNGHCC